MTTIKYWTTAFLGALLPCLAAGERAPQTISIVIYDSAALNPQTLGTAGALAGRIMLLSGLQATWTPGPLSDQAILGTDFSPPANGVCSGMLDPTTLRVQILPVAPVGFSRSAAAYSLPCARTGIQVTIYADRVSGLATAASLPFSRVLGYAIVHEVGHVLLHSDKHESQGLMKAIWSQRDWERAGVSLIPFTQTDSRRMIQSLQEARTTKLALLAPSPRP
jgi:hypothetical protein